MRRSPFTLLVCLVFITSIADAAERHSTIRVIVDPAMSAFDSGVPLFGEVPSDPDTPYFTHAAAPRLQPHVRLSGRSAIKPVVKCKQNLCAPPIPCGPPSCNLPQRRWGQWELSAQVFYARVRGKLKWSDPVAGFVHPAIDFNDGGMGLPNFKWLMEYSARYQFRPNWSCFYSIMPIEMDVTSMNPNFPGILFKTKWEHLYQRVGILYQPIVTCNASVSVYTTWMFQDQKFRMNAGSHCVQNRTIQVDRTRHMLQSGIEVQKCIRTLCNGGTLSCDNRLGLTYLDGAFGIDLQTGFRFSVPMNCGRWGYARGGYRLLQFTEDRPDFRLDTTLEGWIGELGIIF